MKSTTTTTTTEKKKTAKKSPAKIAEAKALQAVRNLCAVATEYGEKSAEAVDALDAVKEKIKEYNAELVAEAVASADVSKSFQVYSSVYRLKKSTRKELTLDEFNRPQTVKVIAYSIVKSGYKPIPVKEMLKVMNLEQSNAFADAFLLVRSYAFKPGAEDAPSNTKIAEAVNAFCTATYGENFSRCNNSQARELKAMSLKPSPVIGDFKDCNGEYLQKLILWHAENNRISWMKAEKEKTAK